MGNRNRQEGSIDDLLDRLNQMYGADKKSGKSSAPKQDSTGSGEVDPELRRLLERAIADGEADPEETEPSLSLSMEDLPERPAGQDRDEISARAAVDYSHSTRKICGVGLAEKGLKVARDLCGIEPTLVNGGNSRAETAVHKLLFFHHFNQYRRGASFARVSCNSTHNKNLLFVFALIIAYKSLLFNQNKKLKVF